jgi:hypothetical protein
LGRHTRTWRRCFHMGFFIICHECNIETIHITAYRKLIHFT